MTVRIWNSFSCNNSSSYLLVARFANAAAASEVAAELTAFFSAYAAQMDQIVEDNDYRWPDNPAPAAHDLAAKYGFEWKKVLGWGDEGLAGDEPDVIATDEVVAVVHGYCGGFGDEIPAYLAARGGTVEPQSRANLHVTVMFRYSGDNPALDHDLAELFSQVDDELRDVEPLVTPWKTRDAYGSAAFYRDRRTVAMTIPTHPPELAELRNWLAGHGITSPSIRIASGADEAKLVAIAGAQCAACDNSLELWHPLLDDIDHEQLVCTRCGGMYDLTTFLPRA